MKAFLKNHRQAPRKVRLVTDAIKGKTVAEALSILMRIQKKATTPLSKVLLSAAANAKVQGVSDPMQLYISDIRVDKGLVQTRYRAQARGRAVPLKHESSHVFVGLSTEKKKK